MSNKITLTLSPDSAFLLGGMRGNAAYNAATALDKKTGLPFIPATAIKGAVRMDFEAFFRGVDASGQLPGEFKTVICNLENKARDEDGHIEYSGCGECLTCKLFGGGNKEGKLRFNAAFIKEGDEKKSLADVIDEVWPKGRREGVSISRTLGKAREANYYSRLTFPDLRGVMALSFDASIDIYGGLDDMERRYLEVFFTFLKGTGLSIGAGKSTGLGNFKIEFHIPEIHESPPVVVSPQREGELKLYVVTLKTLEPLVVGSTKNRYIIDTKPYIPASTMGGSIGFGLVRHGVDDDTMRYLFNLDKKKSRISPFNFYMQTPFPNACSLREPKGKEEERNDILLRDFVLHRAIDKGLFGNKTFQDLYKELYRSDLRPVETGRRPDMTYITKIGIDRQLQRAGDGMLYSMETIDAGTEFRGFLIAEEWVKETLSDMKHLFIGAKRTRGYGRTCVENIKELDREKLLNVNSENNTNPIDADLKQLAKEYEIDLSKDHERFFYALDLLFDFSIPDEYTDKEPDKIVFHHFKEMCFKDIDDIKLEKAYVRSFWQGGYDFKRKKQKPFKQMIGAGSTFLVSISAAQDDAFREHLRNMVRNSIDFNWDNTPLFMVNCPVHLKLGGKI